MQWRLQKRLTMSSARPDQYARCGQLSACGGGGWNGKRHVFLRHAEVMVVAQVGGGGDVSRWPADFGQLGGVVSSGIRGITIVRGGSVLTGENFSDGGCLVEFILLSLSRDSVWRLLLFVVVVVVVLVAAVDLGMRMFFQYRGVIYFMHAARGAEALPHSLELFFFFRFSPAL